MSFLTEKILIFSSQSLSSLRDFELTLGVLFSFLSFNGHIMGLTYPGYDILLHFRLEKQSNMQKEKSRDMVAFSMITLIQWLLQCYKWIAIRNINVTRPVNRQVRDLTLYCIVQSIIYTICSNQYYKVYSVKNMQYRLYCIVYGL